MPLSLQPKFLRAIQEGEGRRLGSLKTCRYDMRIISSTNRDLRKEVEEDRFRDDLFYRLFSLEVYLPPLRKRKEDILPLALSFLEETGRNFHKSFPGFSPEVMAMLHDYAWPGNVRQLRREVERLAALSPEGAGIAKEYCSRDVLDYFTVNKKTVQADVLLGEQVRDLEKKAITRALKKSGKNKVKAAAMLGITRQGLDKKLRRYGISLDELY